MYAPRYIPPMKTADGLLLTDQSAGVGMFTLVAGVTYVYILGTGAPRVLGVQLTGYDATLVITSATVQDTLHNLTEVSHRSLIVGDWVTENPTTGFVANTGTGWSVTSGVVAATGAGLGGAVWQISESAAYRTRLTVVVGATGGRVRVSGLNKS